MCRPPRLECKNPRRNAAVYHSLGMGFFRDLTVKNVVFRCSRYVALPAIIPHGRGEGERFVYSCYGDVGYSVSPSFVDCNITNVPTTVCKVGKIVVVTVSGTLKKAVGAFSTLSLSNVLPKARGRFNSTIISQDTSDPRILLTAIGTDLFIETKGPSLTKGTWMFGQLVYVCD